MQGRSYYNKNDLIRTDGSNLNNFVVSYYLRFTLNLLSKENICTIFFESLGSFVLSEDYCFPFSLTSTHIPPKKSCNRKKIYLGNNKAKA